MAVAPLAKLEASGASFKPGAGSGGGTGFEGAGVEGVDCVCPDADDGLLGDEDLADDVCRGTGNGFLGDAGDGVDCACPGTGNGFLGGAEEGADCGCPGTGNGFLGGAEEGADCTCPGTGNGFLGGPDEVLPEGVGNGLVMRGPGGVDAVNEGSA